MKLKSGIVPMLATGNMEASIAFYRDALGFEPKDKFESGGTTWWCELEQGTSKIMLTQHETRVDAPGAYEIFGQTSLAFYVEDVTEVHARLRDRGLLLSDVRVTFYGMKEFDLRDPTGYTLLIGQRTDEAPTVEESDKPPF